jgi:predicted HTH domain antitoxin
MTIQINDSYINTLFETRFHKNQVELVNEIKKLFQNQSRVEQYEYSLLKAYEKGELSIGQVANILSISKNETMELLKKYDIPFINVDEIYLDQEFKAFS